MSGTYAVGLSINLPGLILELVVLPTYFDTNSLNAPYYFVILDDGALNNYLNTNLSVEIVNPEANTVQISRWS